jgi:hypothetical protein
MKGLVRLCDLSPDGSTLIYWAAQYHPRAVERRIRLGNRAYQPVRAGTAMAAETLRRRGRKVPRYLLQPAGNVAQPAPQENQGTWTAISNVPWFTALAIWPAFGHWTGGGAFAADQSIVLFEPQERMTPVVTVPIPGRLHFQSAFALPGRGSDVVRSARGPDQPFNATDRHRFDPGIRARLGEMELQLKEAGFRSLDWAHAIGPDVLISADGSIFRIPDGKMLAPRDYAGRARRLIDLSPMSFQLLRASPEEMRWKL